MELNEDKILDFLDGSLTGAEEEELLHRLAVSPERRVVLKQHLQLRELSSILAKKHNYIVPKLLTAQLFTSLSANGYAGPMYHAATDTDTLRSSLEANVGKSAENVVEAGTGIRRSSLVFSSVLSFIAGAFLVYLLVSSPSQSTGSIAVVDGQGSGSAANVTSPDAVSRNSGSNNVSNSATTTVATTTNTPTSNTQTPASRIEAGNSLFSGNILNTKQLETSDMPEATTSQPVIASTVEFGSVNHAIDLGSIPAAGLVDGSEVAESEGVQFAINENEERIERFAEAKPMRREIAPGDLHSVESKPWWQGAGMFSTLDNLRREKGYFGLDVVEDTVPFIRRTMVSVRSGGGKAPGRNEDYTGSLVEFKLSADIGDWLVAKVSFGQFMPYETEALSIGKNSDGVRMLKLVPVLQYRSVVGAELGFRTQVLGATFEAMGGFISDLRNGLIPRAGLFTTLMLRENLSLQMGVEGALYTHDIRPSLVNKQMIFAVENPVLTNAMQETETAGFIGPAVELAWHF